MMQKTFTDISQKNIKNIHALSAEFNNLRQEVHTQVLLDLMAEHIEEIRELHGSKNDHYLVETGDLLILCLELLAEAKADPDFIMDKCYKRYNKKLYGLIKEFKKTKKE